MLRQYFMALRTLGKWKYLNEPHWDAVAEIASPVMERPCPFEQQQQHIEQKPSESAWSAWLARRRGEGVAPAEEDSDAEDEDEDRAVADERLDLEVLLMRKYFWRWAARTGYMAGTCDSMEADAVNVDWTRVIAPAVEGRITNVKGP